MVDERLKDRKPQSPLTSNVQGASQGQNVAIQFCACILVGAALGYGFDILLGTLPLFLILLLFLGFAAGLRVMWKALNKPRVKTGGVGDGVEVSDGVEKSSKQPPEA